MGKKDWHVYGVCPECGYSERAALGDMWFLEKEIVVCPICGIHASRFGRKVGRRVIIKKGKHFWSRNRWGMEWNDERGDLDG